MENCTTVNAPASEYTKTHAGNPLPCAKRLSADESLRLRFFGKVDLGDDCWEWCGRRNERGYGQVWVSGRGCCLAHRVAFMLANGRWPHCDLVIRHTCDNRRCVNPAHLVEGTQLENIEDTRIRRGWRWKNGAGTGW